MKNYLYSVEEVSQMISAGKRLVLAGEEALLASLPKGEWIGGTIPYFMGDRGGEFIQDRIFVSEFESVEEDYKINFYDHSQIRNIPGESFQNGFCFVLVPGLVEILKEFAIEIPNARNLYDNPLVGWIAGVALGDIGKKTPKVFDGTTGRMSDKHIAVMHVEIPDGKVARLEIVNIFEQGSGDVFTFEKPGFTFHDCLINGKKQNLSDYIEANNLDIRFPLVADYSGAMINVSFQNIDKEDKRVDFYAPLLPGYEYRQAAPITDYLGTFRDKIPVAESEVVFSCNCILNYLYAELEGKTTGIQHGPFTFGEIGYQLLNQTLTYLVVE